MKLWAGLGNPGARYSGNRHNIGFMALDRIAADHGFAPWRKAFHGLVSEGRLGAEKVVLLKPETFMNLSGQSVQAAVTFYKLPLADVTVFHDELDLAPGKCRVKSGGGHAGHNGLRSIHQHLGEGYGRVRLGIGHPGHKDAVAGYVLHDFAKAGAGRRRCDALHERGIAAHRPAPVGRRRLGSDPGGGETGDTARPRARSGRAQRHGPPDGPVPQGLSGCRAMSRASACRNAAEADAPLQARNSSAG
jgi:PTH1 family peptidyl-tRNA hydrolase